MKSSSKLGAPKTPEHRANISAALKGKIKTPEHRANLSAAQNKTFLSPDGAQMRPCCICSLTLPLSEFYPRKKRGGYMAACILCGIIQKSVIQCEKRIYGLNLESWDEMVLNRGGMCDICGKDAKLCVDHDHNTGEIRGLLCPTCNSGIGFLKDSSAVAQLASEYLKRRGK